MPKFTADFTADDVETLVRADIQSRFPGARLTAVESTWDRYSSSKGVHVEFDFEKAEPDDTAQEERNAEAIASHDDYLSQGHSAKEMPF